MNIKAYLHERTALALSHAENGAYRQAADLLADLAKTAKEHAEKLARYDVVNGPISH